MIVRDVDSGFLLITQPDHARLAARVMQHWAGEDLPSRPTRTAALFATEHHDDGWHEEDMAPSTQEGRSRPFDFIDLPVERRRAVWPRAVAGLSHVSTYAAALVAQHALTVYRRFRTDPSWAEFFEQLEHERDRWYSSDTRPDGSAGGPVDPLRHERLSFLQDYGTLRLGDIVSLVFCNGWTAPEEHDGYRIVLEGDTVCIAPDPFDSAAVPLRIEARRVPREAAGDERALRDAFRTAPVEYLDGVAVGAALAS